MGGNGQVSVPPGFRFHPTDEELLYYYLRKKVSYEPIDLDVIREVDLNKLEPWELKDKCGIGSGPQNEWYFFSHKDKKYPTGTRTNRATTAGFWKATGRDKAIHLSSSKRIGMRKTLVFYTGRAPHGQKTDWIMHEYRLDDDNSHQQEDGWVVCRVFRKKTQSRGYLPEVAHLEEEEELFSHHQINAPASAPVLMEPRQTHRHHHHHHHHHHALQGHYDYNYSSDGSMHLPQLFSPELFEANLNSAIDVECSHHNLLRLTSSSGAQRPFNGDWSFLDKLLASHSHHHQSLLDQQPQCKGNHSTSHVHDVATSSSHQKFPFPYLGSEADILKFSK